MGGQFWPPFFVQYFMIKKIICLLKIYVRFIDINLIQNNKMEENLLNTEQTNDAQDQIDLANASLIFAKASSFDRLSGNS